MSSKFAETDPRVLHAFIAAHPLGAVVSATSAGLQVSHLPWLLNAEGALGTLEGHIARGNPHAGALLDGSEVLVIFAGHDSYITPSYYPSKQEHGKVVPTWNYAAAHAWGRVRRIEERSALLAHLGRLTDAHERTRAHPWSIDDAPREYVEALSTGTIGLVIAIERLEGKWKMSQNRGEADVAGVVAGLRASDDPRARAVAETVRERSLRECPMRSAQ